MKNKISLVALLFIALIACKKEPTVKPADLATEAMERARAAEADIYAPVEYNMASALYDQMNDELEDGNVEEADLTAEKVVNAANEAIRAARQNKATTTIAELKSLLEQARSMGADKNNADVYNQANQALINAEYSYENNDYAQAYDHAEQGRSLLETVLGGQEALALANLNRARELLDRAYRTTELTFSEDILIQASNEIEMATDLYQEQQYADSIQYTDSAIMKIEEMIEKFPNDATVSVKVNAGNDNIQLQAYDLLRRLGNTIEYIEENSYTNDIEIQQPIKPLPTVPAQQSNAPGHNPSSETTLELSQSALLFRAQAFDEISAEQDNIYENAFYGENEDEFTVIVDTDEEAMMGDVVADDNTAEPISKTNTGSTLTLEIIANIHRAAQQEYNNGNYLNAADLSREGLRLADLYLAGQTLTTHTVVRGDTLWDISGKTYKNRRYWLWPNIWRANKLIIKDPDLIYPNQRFRVPPAPQQQ